MATALVVRTLLTRPIAFHPVLARICESANAGLMLSQAIYWSERTNDVDGWFYKTQSDWTDEICLSRDEQKTARAKLRKFSFWQEERRGLSRQLYYRVDLEQLSLAIANHVQNPRTDVQKPLTDVQIPRTDVQIPPSIKEAETTSETTSETTQAGTSPSASASLFQDLPQSKPSDQKGQALLHVWDYFLDRIGKHRKLYTLTDKRQKMGLARLQDALKKVDGKFPKAIELMEIAIDQLAASDFHNARGKYEGQTSYNNWENVFRSTDKFEEFLDRSNG